MEEQPENEEPMTSEELLGLLSNPEALSEMGYRLTPKGHMSLVMMKFGATKEIAEYLSEQISNAIFLAGWTYLSQEQLEGLGISGAGDVDDL